MIFVWWVFVVFSYSHFKAVIVTASNSSHALELLYFRPYILWLHCIPVISLYSTDSLKFCLLVCMRFLAQSYLWSRSGWLFSYVRQIFQLSKACKNYCGGSHGRISGYRKVFRWTFFIYNICGMRTFVDICGLCSIKKAFPNHTMIFFSYLLHKHGHIHSNNWLLTTSPHQSWFPNMYGSIIIKATIFGFMRINTCRKMEELWYSRRNSGECPDGVHDCLPVTHLIVWLYLVGRWSSMCNRYLILCFYINFR